MFRVIENILPVKIIFGIVGLFCVTLAVTGIDP